jgi:O-antigen ligase
MTRSNGFLHWVFPAMLMLVGLTVIFSGRDLATQYEDLQAFNAGFQHPVVIWVQRAVSLLLLAAAAERIISHIALHKHLPSAVLAAAFVVYWLATVAAPAVLSSHPKLAHEYLYTLIIGFAVVISGGAERDKIVDASRNALVLFMLASVLLIPVQPSLVIETSYAQGLLPGVPRLGGLAPHAVAMGMFALTGLLLLWARPFRRTWLTRLSWILCFGAMFLSQSKTAWISFVLCAAAMLAVRNGPSFFRRLGDPRQSAAGIVACLGVMAAAAVLLVLVLVGDLEGKVVSFLNTSEGAQLVSLTGRDQIWAVAIEEWQANRLFGYGPTLFDDDFRASIGMPNATHGHNQFMDTLARSGSVGAVALVLYALVLLVLSVRHARATGGLSLALFVALAMRSVSEVPLLLFGYGSEVFAHLLLLVVLASSGKARVEVTAGRRRPTYGTAA